jgi:transcriptional regulator with XRE-family HTH domain
MKAENWFENLEDSFQDDIDYRLEKKILQITETFCELMEQKGLKKSDLAKKLNVSPAAISKILNGTPNFTLKKLLSMGDALDTELTIYFEPKIHTGLTQNYPILQRHNAYFMGSLIGNKTLLGADDDSFCSPTGLASDPSHSTGKEAA